MCKEKDLYPACKKGQGERTWKERLYLRQETKIK